MVTDSLHHYQACYAPWWVRNRCDMMLVAKVYSLWELHNTHHGYHHLVRWHINGYQTERPHATLLDRKQVTPIGTHNARKRVAMVILLSVNRDNLDIGVHLGVSCFLFPSSALGFGLRFADGAQVSGCKADVTIHRRLDWLLRCMHAQHP